MSDKYDDEILKGSGQGRNTSSDPKNNSGIKPGIDRYGQKDHVDSMGKFNAALRRILSAPKKKTK